jgi:hypothetical protein
LACWGHLGI